MRAMALSLFLGAAACAGAAGSGGADTSAADVAADVSDALGGPDGDADDTATGEVATGEVATGDTEAPGDVAPLPDADTTEETPDASAADADLPDAPDAQDATDAGPPEDASPDADTTPEPTWQEKFDHVFPQDHVVDLRLTFPPGEWHALLLEWQQTQAKIEHEAALDFDDEHVASVGVRLKGLNSLNVPMEGPIPLDGKYPLKVDFNTFGGPRFHDVDEINLGRNGSDPSLMRERLAERVYLAMGVPASRSSHAHLTVDGAPVGLYTMVQVIDKRYLKERFGTANHADDGNLYKCVHNSLGVCSLEWRGATKEDYIQAEGCAAGYETCGLLLKTNEDDPAQNDYADLIHLLDVLNHTPDEELAEALEPIFDVDSFLRLWAVAFAIGNWDSYFGKGHNFYLYHRPDTGRFMMLPWDLDLTYEAPSCSPDPTELACWGGDQKPLTARLLKVPAYEAKLVEYVKEVVEHHLTVETHAAWIEEMDALLAAQVTKDPNLDAYAYAAMVDPLGTDPQNLYRWVEQRHAELAAALGLGE